MKKRIKSFLALPVFLIVLCLCACGQSKDTAVTTADTTSAGIAATTEKASEIETETLLGKASDTGTVEFTDGAGRTVTIPTPENLERVYTDSTNSLVIMYILAPDMITASPTEFTEADLPYVMKDKVGLPSYGTRSGSNGVLDYEAMKAADLQLIISSFQGTEATDSDIQQADEMQEQLGIPVIIVSSHLDSMEKSFTLLGEALGHQKEAETVIAYFNNVVDKVTSAVAKVPEERKLTMYYAEGKDGLATEPANSPRSIVFNMCGLDNLATVEALSGFGQSAVSMEAVLSWDPEVIIVQSGTGAYEVITSSEDWSSVTAVREGRVYEMPSDPFGWADRPPGPNRYIGLLWLADLLYPDEMNIDFTDTVIDYYKVIYHVDITAEDVDALLVNAWK